MKKIILSKMLIAFMVVNLLAPGLMAISGQKQAYAFSEDESVDSDIDPGTIAALAGAAVAMTVGLFCPKTPQNRCKNGSCQSGACISFRSACSGSGECGSDGGSAD